MITRKCFVDIISKVLSESPSCLNPLYLPFLPSLSVLPCYGAAPLNPARASGGVLQALLAVGLGRAKHFYAFLVRNLLLVVTKIICWYIPILSLWIRHY